MTVKARHRENIGAITRFSTFYQAVVFSSAGSAAYIVFLFLETLVAVRLLAPTDYGVYVLIVVVVTFAATMIDFGCTTAVTQLIAGSETDRQTNLAHTVLVFRLLLIATVSTLMWFGQDLFGFVDSSGKLLQYQLFIPIMLATYSLDELFLGILQGFHAYHHIAVSQAMRGVLRVLLTTLLLVVFQLGTAALIYSWIFSFVICSTYQFFVLPIPKRILYHHPLLGEIVRFGLPIQLNQLVRIVFIRIDVLLLGALVGPGGVALYAVAARIPQAVQQLSDSYIVVFFPTISTFLAKKEFVKANWMFNSSLRILSFVSAVIALVAVLFSHEIVSLVFSEKYAASSWVFALLMVALHMTIILNLMGYTLTAGGYPGRSLIGNSVGVVTNILANLALVPLLGIFGPALARIISLYVGNPLHVWLLRRSEILVVVSPYVKQTVLLLVCLTLFWWIHPTGLLSRIAIIPIYVIAACLLSTLSREDLALILPEVATKRLGASMKV